MDHPPGRSRRQLSLAALGLLVAMACDASTGDSKGTDAASSGDVLATECQRELAARGVLFRAHDQPLEHPMDRPELWCTVDDPVLIEPVIRGVTFRPREISGTPTPLFAACSLGLALDRMSERLAARSVKSVVHFGIYGCRLIAGTDVLSEHGRARALDVAALQTTAGTVYTVLTDWEKDQPAPTTEGGIFLRQTASELFDSGVFNVILTPDFNADHHDHFHFDLTPDVRLFR
jgi:hypothetical protein